MIRPQNALHLDLGTSITVLLYWDRCREEWWSQRSTDDDERTTELLRFDFHWIRNGFRGPPASRWRNPGNEEENRYLQRNRTLAQCVVSFRSSPAWKNEWLAPVNLLHQPHFRSLPSLISDRMEWISSSESIVRKFHGFSKDDGVPKFPPILQTP